MRKIAVLTVILLFSGCICCGGKSIKDLVPGTGDAGGGDESTSEEGGQSCEKPYIQVGSECCLDENDNGVCDSEDATNEVTTTVQGEETATTQKTMTTAGAAETTATVTQGQATTTTRAQTVNSPVYNCVSAAGLDANAIYFAYSQRCGSEYVAAASQVSITKGVDIKPINIGGFIDDKKVALLECFYGKGSPEMSGCPRLLCPKTGLYKTLTGRGGSTVRSQMEGFSNECG